MDTQANASQPCTMIESASNRTVVLRQLSPEMIALLERHFWCDFSDTIPALAWQTMPDNLI